MTLRYTDLKIFHYPEKLRTLTSNTPISSPLHIRIKPTNQCNHRCWYCAYRNDSMQLGQDMRVADSIPENKMYEIIDDCIEMGVQGVTFSGGGEPFVYPHLLETAKRLCSGGVKIASLTNGARLHGEVAEFFAHNATWVRVSMDGWDDASYSDYRNVGDGEHTKIINNMRHFLSMNGACALSVNINIDEKNWRHLKRIFHDLQDVGITNVKVAGCIVSNNATEVNAYHAPFFEACKNEIVEAVESMKKDGFSIHDCYHIMSERFEKNYTWCPFSQILTVIGADCNVYSCQDKAYNLENGLLGSLKNDRFKSFWFSSRDKFQKINPSIHCQHHCVANNKNKLLFEYLNVDMDHLAFV